MDLKLKGRRALVTGGSKGIGLATAIELAGEGCDVVIAARDPATIESAVKASSAGSSGQVAGVVADLSLEAERVRLLDEAGPLDILINNAGAIPAGDLQTISVHAWRHSWELKLFGFVSLCRLAYPAMIGRGGGVIVNIMGAAGERPDPDYIAGSTANAALMAFTRALGHEAPRHGVRVVGINPGFTLTDRARRLLQDRALRVFGDGNRWG
jgi:NAD(P)-dependent dehydrogenase (short-subunit alcohol dehydrogenase family)